jgi:hypothetical protein
MPVSLQACGVSSATVWVSLPGSFVTSGTDTLTSRPYLLTATSATGTLTMERRYLLLRGSGQDTSQMWATQQGAVG